MDLLKAYNVTEESIRRFLRRFIANEHDIDDICQEAITRALEASQVSDIVEPRGFLFGIARNVMRREMERRSKSLIDYLDAATGADEFVAPGTTESRVDSDQQLRLCAAVVATLPPQCPRVFVLKKVYGFSHKEIARKLDISVSTVEKHVAAAMKRFMDRWEREHHLSTAISFVRDSSDLPPRLLGKRSGDE